MTMFSKPRICAIAAVLALAAPTVALARGHHRVHPPIRPELTQPVVPQAPPPWLLYPQPKSSATTDRLPHVRSQVPVGRAGPGVTPYEMLPNKP